MSAPENAEIWRSDEVVANWVADVDARERRRLPRWELMALLLPYGQDEPFVAADLGAGTGPAARAILSAFPAATVRLADFSEQMIEEGTKSLASFEGRFEYVRFDLEHDDWPAGLGEGLGAVVTSLCVHHIPDARKAWLFQEIHRHLAPGGWYVNYDPIRAEDPEVEAAWTRASDRLDPEAAERRVHRSELEAARHANHVRYMIPLRPQLELLTAAGFQSIDVFWKHLDYVIYGGRRAG